MTFECDYGVYAFVVMNEKIPGLFKETVSSAMFSRAREEEGGKKRVSTYWVPELGKNVSPIKLWIPARMRRDLQTLSDHVGIPLSQYLREIVISRLLSCLILSNRGATDFNSWLWLETEVLGAVNRPRGLQECGIAIYLSPVMPPTALVVGVLNFFVCWVQPKIFHASKLIPRCQLLIACV